MEEYSRWNWTTRPRHHLVLLIFFFLLIIILPDHLTLSDRSEDDNLLQGLNSFRQASGLPILSKHDNANCVANAIADQLEDQSCSSNSSLTQSRLTSTYPNVLQQCKVDVNSTRDGVVLPVCVPDRVATLVLTNYTHSPPSSRYLNDSRFTGAGVGTEDDWTVLVLATNTPAGSFANGAAAASCPLAAGCFVGVLVLLLCRMHGVLI